MWVATPAVVARRFSHLLATGPELPTDYSLENPSDLTHSLTLWQPDLSLPRTIGNPLRFDAALVKKLVPCAWLLSGALEVWSLRLRLVKIRDVVYMYVQITNISLASRLSCRSRSLTAVTSHRLAREICHTLSSDIIIHMHLNGKSL